MGFIIWVLGLLLESLDWCNDGSIWIWAKVKFMPDVGLGFE
jgi:hypothetical protein